MIQTPEKQDDSIAPYLALLGVQVCFGSLAVIGKVALAVFPPVALVGFRVGITALVLFAVQAFRGRIWLQERSDYLKFALLSIVAVTANQLLFVTGLSLTKASNTSLLAVTIPVFTLTIGAILGKEVLERRKMVGIVLAAIGVIILIDPRNASFSSETTVGDILVILNSLSYGIYVAISKDIVTRNGAFRSIMWIFLFASIICVPAGLFSLSSVDVANVSISLWLIVLYIAVGATTAPYFLNAWALARVNPSTVAVFVYLQPLIGFILAAVFIGETIDLKFVLAAAIIFVGLFLVIKKFHSVET